MAVTKRKRNGKTIYQAEVYIGGVRIADKAHDTASAAHSWHDSMKKKLKGGMTLTQELTLLEVIAAFREGELKMLLAPSQKNCRHRLKAIEETSQAKIRMDYISAATIDLMLESLIDGPRGKSSSRKSFLGELKMLRRLFEFYRDNFDEKFVSPVTKRHGKKACYKGPVPRKRRDFFLTVEDAKTWLKALATQQDPVYTDLALCQLVMGTRIGEAAALCWDSVDFEAKLIRVRRTMEWDTAEGKATRLIVNRTKTEDSRRELPMPPLIEAMLRERRKAQTQVVVRTGDSEVVRPVFVTQRGRLLFDETIRASYTRAFRKAGLPWTATHICRDTNATLTVGVLPLEVAQVNLGHSSRRQSEDYAKVHAVRTNEAPALVASLLAP